MHSGFDVLFYENCILVLRKPANVPMDGDDSITVEKWILERGFLEDGNEVKKIKWVHQLDSPTSGVLCVALTRRVASAIAHCFQTRTVYKEYTAMVYGHVQLADVAGTEGGLHILDAPVHKSNDEHDLALPLHICVAIGEDDVDDFRMKANGRNSKWSHTEILSYQAGYISSCGIKSYALETSDSPHARCQCVDFDNMKGVSVDYSKPHITPIPVTRVSIRLHTGRRHQIRVHLAQVLRRPIVNDSLYSSCPLSEECHVWHTESTFDSPRLMLHSTKLGFPLNFRDIDTFPSKTKMRQRTRVHQRKNEEAEFTFSEEPRYSEIGTLFVCPDNFPEIRV